MSDKLDEKAGPVDWDDLHNRLARAMPGLEPGMATCAKNAQVQTAPAAVPSEAEIASLIYAEDYSSDFGLRAARAILDLFAPILAEKEREISEEKARSKQAIDDERAGQLLVISPELYAAIEHLPPPTGKAHIEIAGLHCGLRVEGCTEEVRERIAALFASEARALAAESALAELRKQMLADEGQHRDALAAERERCAKIAESVGNFGDYKREELTADYGQPRFDMMHAIAAAIRAQGE